MTTTPPVTAPEQLPMALADALARGDVQAAAALYAPDAVVGLALGRAAAGRVAIEAAFAGALAQGYLVPVGGDVSVLVAGATAYVSDTDEAGVVRSAVARQRGDGGWEWVCDSTRLVQWCAVGGAEAA